MSNQRLDGDVAAVTGGAGGIGAAVAETLASAGARFDVADVDEERAPAVATKLGGEHVALSIDVRSMASVRAVARRVGAELGAATILFCGAGVQCVRATVDLSEKDWDYVVDINLGGTFRCCQVFATPMVQRGHGAIVNVASLTGVEFGGGARVPYGASKGGVMGRRDGSHARACRRVAPRGVRVNTVAPIIVATRWCTGSPPTEVSTLMSWPAVCRSGT